MIDIDTVTGLPTLPEGCFWRVTSSGDSLHIKLMKKGWLRGTVKSRPIFKTDATASLIEFSAIRVYKEVFGRAHEKFVGDYPPKTLNQ